MYICSSSILGPKIIADAVAAYSASSVNRELTHLAATLAAAQCAPSQNIFMAFLHKTQATQSVFS